MCTFISYHFIGCSAKYFWLLVRHGTRNPSDDDIVEMQTRGVEIQQNIIENHNQGKGICILIHRYLRLSIKLITIFFIVWLSNCKIFQNL